MSRSSVLPLFFAVLVSAIAVAPQPSDRAIELPLDAAARVLSAEATPENDDVRVEALEFTPDGFGVLSYTTDGLVGLGNSDAPRSDRFKLAVAAEQVSPNRQTIARLTPSEDGDTLVELLDPNGQVRDRVLTNFGWGDDVYRLQWSPDSQYWLLLGVDEGTVGIWTHQGDAVAKFQHSGSIETLVWSPDGRRLAVKGLNETTVVSYDRHGRQLLDFESSAAGLEALVFSPTGDRWVATDKVGTVWMYDRSGDRVARLDRGDRQPWRVQFSPDGTRVLMQGRDRATVFLWSTTGHLLAQLQPDADGAAAAEFSPDGTAIATSVEGRDGVRVWNLDGGLKATLPGDRFRWRTGGKDDRTILLTLAKTGSLSLFDVAADEPVQSWRGHRSAAVDAEFSPDGQQFATVDGDGLVRLWTLDGQAVERWQIPRSRVNASEDAIVSIAIRPDNRAIAIAEADATVWQLIIDN
ncbi:hypothetical protein AY599_05135 [Leptolyngbya valderiana BDU 20041]|nr:hypothetical protein AY599_05135 [Leptolyngbya valderiana BDU 20041]